MTRSKVSGCSAALAALLLCSTAHAQEGAPPPPPTAADQVRITLKLVRAEEGGAAAPLRLVQQSCPTCVQRTDPDFARENRRETIVELDIPKDRFLEVRFTGATDAFRRAILQTDDMPMRKDGKDLAVALPPLHEDAVEAGEFATHVTGPGYVLRFEHADPARAAGAYAQTFPAVQRRAANALEFAEREATLELGLGEQVKREGWGVIEIMGFDSNDPHGHLDAPPHIHMHLRWPYNTGTQIGHFYISEAGRLTVNRVGITGYRLPTRTFGPGSPFATLAPKGVTAYTQTITTDGGLRLAAADGRACQIAPRGMGFQDGARVSCDGHAPVNIEVVDDLTQGLIEAHTGAIREVFRYDRDTGKLISPTIRPEEEASGVSPTYTLNFPSPST